MKSSYLFIVLFFSSLCSVYAQDTALDVMKKGAEHPREKGFTHYIGEEFEGGVVYYLTKGEDGIEHGLIVSKTEKTHTKWQDKNSFVKANDSEDGAVNTKLMVHSPAKKYVTSLGEGWYLPSIDELSHLYHFRAEVSETLSSGGFTPLSETAIYWSSTEFVAQSAFAFDFDGGYSGDHSYKFQPYVVRGVKAF